MPAAAGEVATEDESAKALTRAELGRILSALPDGWRLFFEFLVHTGVRISEAVGLTWGTSRSAATHRSRCASRSTAASGAG